VLDIESRGMDSCAILGDDTVRCWGGSAAVPAPPLIARQVSVGDGHACAVRFDDSISCWGDNSLGQAEAPE
jgi:hypothetical protein